MSNHRPAALAAAACAASLTLAACTAGITTAANPPATSAPAAGAPARSASAAAAASSAGPASSGWMVAITGSLRFPVPAGAKVAENVADSQVIGLIFGSVTPAKVSGFYATALPRAGYVVTANSVISQGGGTVAFIQFNGHGYKGTIDALSKFTGSGVDLNGLGTKNVTTVSLMPK
jgi:hypothetical protein